MRAWGARGQEEGEDSSSGCCQVRQVILGLTLGFPTFHPISGVDTRLQPVADGGQEGHFTCLAKLAAVQVCFSPSLVVALWGQSS